MRIFYYHSLNVAFLRGFVIIFATTADDYLKFHWVITMPDIGHRNVQNVATDLDILPPKKDSTLLPQLMALFSVAKATLESQMSVC